MEIRIGVIQTPKEIVVELADDADVAAVKASVEAALGGQTPVLWLADRRGRQVAVAAERLAYVEVGSPDDTRRIGFGAT